MNFMNMCIEVSYNENSVAMTSGYRSHWTYVSNVACVMLPPGEPLRFMSDRLEFKHTLPRFELSFYDQPGGAEKGSMNQSYRVYVRVRESTHAGMCVYIPLVSVCSLSVLGR